jgi:hypothetical protein
MSCRSNQKKLCGNIVCLMCFNRSFAIHPKSQYWSDKNILKLWAVTLNTHTKYYFNYPECIMKYWYD